MKKIKWLSLFLSVLLVMQCGIIPAGAVETTGADLSAGLIAPGDYSASQTSTAEFGTVCIQNGCRTIDGMVPLAGNDRMLDTAQAAFCYEATTGTVIYSYHPDMKMSPGTLTKIISALVVIENAQLDEIVTCSDGIQSKVPGSSHRMSPQLKSGEQLSVEALLHCMLLSGANDATVALAEHVAGTTAAFLEMINKRAKQLGCTNTEFGNISGLDTAVSYSTARDMARIMLAASKNETFMKISGATEYTVPASNLVEERKKFYTNNYLIDQHNIPQFLDNRVTGGVASATDQSGASLACTASYKGMDLVCVTLGSLRVMNEEKSWVVESYGNFNEMLALLKYTFDNFKINRILYDGMAVDQFTVSDGESDAFGEVQVDIDSVVPANAYMSNLDIRSSVKGGGLAAPISRGDQIATVQVWYRYSCLTEAEVFSMGNVVRTADTGVTIHSNAVKAESGGGGGFLSVLGIICVIVLGLVMLYLAFNAYMRSRMRAKRRKRREDRRRIR